jgi:hypothetical protein
MKVKMKQKPMKGLHEAGSALSTEEATFSEAAPSQNDRFGESP